MTDRRDFLKQGLGAAAAASVLGTAAAEAVGPGSAVETEVHVEPDRAVETGPEVGPIADVETKGLVEPEITLHHCRGLETLWPELLESEGPPGHPWLNYVGNQIFQLLVNAGHVSGLVPMFACGDPTELQAGDYLYWMPPEGLGVNPRKYSWLQRPLFGPLQAAPPVPTKQTGFTRITEAPGRPQFSPYETGGETQPFWTHATDYLIVRGVPQLAGPSIRPMNLMRSALEATLRIGSSYAPAALFYRDDNKTAGILLGEYRETSNGVVWQARTSEMGNALSCQLTAQVSTLLSAHNLLFPGAQTRRQFLLHLSRRGSALLKQLLPAYYTIGGNTWLRTYSPSAEACGLLSGLHLLLPRLDPPRSPCRVTLLAENGESWYLPAEVERNCCMQRLTAEVYELTHRAESLQAAFADVQANPAWQLGLQAPK